MACAKHGSSLRRCKICRSERRRSAYYANHESNKAEARERAKRRVWSPEAKERQRLAQRAWYVANRARVYERLRAARAANVSAGLTVRGKPRQPLGRKAIYTAEERKERDRASFRRSESRRRARAKAKFIEILGAKCECIDPRGCAGDDVVVLEFDHKNGDGHVDRRRCSGGRRNAASTLQLIRNDARQFGDEFIKQKYQLLCANCHARKTKENSEHRSIKRERENVAAPVLN